ncbi:hypothetical protein QBC42DRAFT_225014 [Cladorrhinum samala]|uniref:Required for respiratory growth protein 9, mitochondrial n=1 Tax=Cladorrhinum samala TaxID=585594 RepID=A0AAV9HNV1_9PEZI|nr:hypothetical protein QBC42DRAFT_225014 [Cladorrhinum samala]
MALCCRAAALRIFVNSITQISIPATATTHSLPQFRSILGQSSGPEGAKSRSLHTSCASNNANTAGGSGADSGSRTVSNITYHREPQEQKGFKEKAERDGGGDGKKPKWTEERKEEARKLREKLEKEKQREHQQEEKRAQDEKEKEPWRIQKEALKKKFPEGWAPRKKLSPDALAGIRALHAQFPEEYSTEKLSEKFEVSPEAIRRILKSKWTPDTEIEEDRQMRWFERGKKVWSHWAELGKKPPVRWRKEGIVRDPKWNRPRQGQMPDNFVG